MRVNFGFLIAATKTKIAMLFDITQGTIYSDNKFMCLANLLVS